MWDRLCLFMLGALLGGWVVSVIITELTRLMLSR